MLVLMDHKENKSIHSSIAYKLSVLATVFYTDVVILMEPDTFPVSLNSDACSSSSSTKPLSRPVLFYFYFSGKKISNGNQCGIHLEDCRQ
jgi:hypothetical protein